jgi:hypothetical protein
LIFVSFYFAEFDKQFKESVGGVFQVFKVENQVICKQ